MSQRYEAWQYADGAELTFTSPENVARHREMGLMPDDAVLLFAFDADSPEEASAIFHLRMGWEPYKPMGEAQPCPECGRQYYPAGSAWCWQCGDIR